MFGRDKKKTASVILEQMMPPRDTSGDPHPEDSAGPEDKDAGMHGAAEDMIAAFKSGDAKALHEAMCAHHSMYDNSEYEPEED